MNATSLRPPRRAARWRRVIAMTGSRYLMPAIEIATICAMVAIGLATWAVVERSSRATDLLPPAMIAAVMVANLVPAMALLVLLARRVARARAERSELGGSGRLHVRLVALFSVLASLPTLLVVIFASILFQLGIQFWFSHQVRVVLVNADHVAQAYVDENRDRIEREGIAMAGDTRNALSQATVDDSRFKLFVAGQVALRVLSEAAILNVGPDGVPHSLVAAYLDKRTVEQRMPPALLRQLGDGQPHVSVQSGDRIEMGILIDPGSRIYLYASRMLDPDVLKQAQRATSALNAYNQLLARARTLQVKFNAALLLISLLVVAAAIWIALAVADRVTRPVAELVGAARRVAAGDLAARVPSPKRLDEVGTLARAFNRMTRRLEEQTGALVAANHQSDSRRAFTEAVLSGVTAGVVSIDPARRVRLINRSAEALLRSGADPVGRPLAETAPELDRFLDTGLHEDVVQVASGGEPRTLAIKRVRAGDGDVLTFDDITQQLTDQRRAAWSDVARRIAHEIKNPLTPIQLAAERLQRRYGRVVEDDPATFEKLTGTIVRQVADMRRMVDEFSSFARMPRPEFAAEDITAIARQALFLHEVAHPAIAFSIDAPTPEPTMVCDRRQMAQAFTNVIKNAAEAVDSRTDCERRGEVRMAIIVAGDELLLSLADNGVGLPRERERITEPYMTTRAKGTGLGLAIVKNIVEQHLGTIDFDDRPGGGTIVTMRFDLAKLAPLAPSETLPSQFISA